jgi:hypothetical protein
MVRVGEYRGDASALGNSGHHRCVSGNHQRINQPVLPNPLHYTSNQWLAGQELKRFVRETGGA